MLTKKSIATQLLQHHFFLCIFACHMIIFEISFTTIPIYPNSNKHLAILSWITGANNNRDKRQNKNHSFVARAHSIVLREGVKRNAFDIRGLKVVVEKRRPRARVRRLFSSVYFRIARSPASSHARERQAGGGGDVVEAICLSRADSFRLQTRWIVCAKTHPL